jgi:hypothetical protein
VFGTKWYYKDDGYFEVIPVIENLIDAFCSESISPKFAYDFRAELIGLSSTELPYRAIEKEVIRLIKRHAQKDFKDKAKDIVEDLMRLKTNGVSLDEISKMLIISTFLARRENQ